VDGTGLICLAHRVRTEVGDAPLHDSLVFFWSSCVAIVGGEFRKIRLGHDHRNATVRVECDLTLRIGAEQIGLLAVLLKRDRNQRPRSYEVFARRLRGYRKFGGYLAIVYTFVGGTWKIRTSVFEYFIS
jgi:hypothetical protein